MKLMTEEIKKRMPKLYSQEHVKDPIVQVKFFTPWAGWSWYGYEWDGHDRFFGYVVGHEKELGYFSLKELESVRGPMGLRIERDLYFKPTPLSVIMSQHGETNPRRDRYQIYDNGGTSIDRYTLVAPDGSVFSFSGEPFHPQGVGLYVGEYGVGYKYHRGWGKRITIGQLPENAQKFVRERIENPSLNPRPPKGWWDAMYRRVKRFYPRLGKERLSKITGRIWWNIRPRKRAKLIAYYDRGAVLRPLKTDKLRAELRHESTTKLHRLVTARETPEATRNMAQEVLWERGRRNPMLPAFTQLTGYYDNPRPPKEWWDKMYAEVKRNYPRLRKNKERLSMITGRIWWNIAPKRRAELIAYYDRKARMEATARRR